MTDLVAVPSSASIWFRKKFQDSGLYSGTLLYDLWQSGSRHPQRKAKNVVIIGAGQVGMMALVSAKSTGCQQVIISGTTKDTGYRFSVAQKLGADQTIDSLTTDLPGHILELTGGTGADIILDASGSDTAISQAIQAVKKGGLILAMGMTRKENIPIPWDTCLKKAIRLQFFMQSNYAYMDEAIQAFSHPYTGSVSPNHKRNAAQSVERTFSIYGYPRYLKKRSLYRLINQNPITNGPLQNESSFMEQRLCFYA